MDRVRTGLGIAIACGGLAAADLAHTATFEVIRAGAGTITLLDPAAIEAVGDGHLRRARSISVQKNLVSGGPQQPGYVVTQNEYDCTQWMIRWTGFSVYSRFGALVLHKDNPDPSWGPIDRHNVEATTGSQVVCEGHGTGSVYAAATVGNLVLALMQAWDAEAPLPPLQSAAPPKAHAKRTLGKAHAPKPGDKAAKPR